MGAPQILAIIWLSLFGLVFFAFAAEDEDHIWPAVIFLAIVHGFWLPVLVTGGFFG